MAWSTSLVEMLRYVIYDIDPSNYTWSDAQLQKFICLATIQVDSLLSNYHSITLGPYLVDFTNSTITPDPTTNGSPQGFSNLIVIKAAEIISGSEFKKISASAGFIIKDDRSTIDTTNTLTSAKSQFEAFKTGFGGSLEEFKEGNKYAGSAILSPYASSNRSIPIQNPHRWGDEGIW